MCANTDDPALPASLSSSYGVWSEQVSSWRQTFHDVAHSMALECGRVRLAIDVMIARDVAGYRTAVSAFYGVTAGLSSMNLAEPTLKSGVLGDGTESMSTESVYWSTAMIKVQGSSSQSTAAAARPVETRFMIAAAAMAGVAGMFAAL